MNEAIKEFNEITKALSQAVATNQKAIIKIADILQYLQKQIDESKDINFNPTDGFDEDLL